MAGVSSWKLLVEHQRQFRFVPAKYLSDSCQNGDDDDGDDVDEDGNDDDDDGNDDDDDDGGDNEQKEQHFPAEYPSSLFRAWTP